MSRVNVGKEIVRKGRYVREMRRSIFRGLFGIVLFLCVGANIFGMAKRGKRGEIVGNNCASLN
jgi:hypothetical protein